MDKKRSMFYPNMNLMRYLLSFGILLAHFDVLTGENIPYFIPHDRIGGFFALSGFLMFHSYMKIGKLKGFVMHRARRILPTYLFIVVTCAIFGVFLTTYSAYDYFLSSGFWKYLGANICFLNFLCPSLPGLFDGPQFMNNVVNASLWTMKVEWLLDLSVPLFVWVMIKTRWRKDYMAIVLMILSMIVRLILSEVYGRTGNEMYAILGRQFLGQMSFFYAGMLVYFYREWVERHNYQVILTGLILYFLTPYIPYASIYLAPPAVAMLFIGISLIGRTIKAFVHVNCISYNIFLLHYPVIQVLVFFGLREWPVWIGVGITTIITVFFAYLTNRFIDRPFAKSQRAKMIQTPKS